MNVGDKAWISDHKQIGGRYDERALVINRIVSVVEEKLLNGIWMTKIQCEFGGTNVSIRMWIASKRLEVVC